MKVGIVYTSTTPELIATVENELNAALAGGAEYCSFQDPSILAEVRQSDYVTPTAAARLVGLFVNAVNDGADVILNCCSSVGEVADASQDLGKFTGIPIVRIDEEMCRAAVRAGTTIAVMATLSSTLEPTKNTIRRVAREMNKHVVLIDVLVENAFGLSPDEFKSRMLEYAQKYTAEADVILFAQGSMAYCEGLIAEKTGKPVLSSPRFGALAVREALKAKGLVS
ncbi:MAG: aspartate/glutamate racemase family protein [Methylobacteriaceae bacterium]|nr:aspartate/glutamate racemase family protein [Methylobacteriaceae bacterium]